MYLVFHVSFLKEGIGDPGFLILLEKVSMENCLSYEIVSFEILDRLIVILTNKDVSLVWALWRNQSVERATGEIEANMRAKYPYPFSLVLVFG